MDQQNFRKILQKYENGSCSDSERKLVDEWLGQLSDHGDGTIHNPLETKEKFLQNIESVVGSTNDKRVAFRYRLAMAAGIAAILLVAFGVIQQFYLKDWASSLTENTTKQEATGTLVNHSKGSKIAHLSDGSEVTLYANSKLTNVSFTEGERRMHLEGKAFFKVSPNPKRPFIIVTEKLITKVLGTSFTIQAEKGKTESVAVKTGKVAVYKGSNVELKNLPGAFVAVTPNHQVHFDEANEKLVTSIVNHPVTIPMEHSIGGKDADATPVMKFEMKFEETSVVEVLKALETAYGVKINYDSKKTPDCIITANLKDEDLFMRLQVVCDLIGGNYRIEGEVIHVKSNGCK